VTLRLVAAGENNDEQDQFAFSLSVDGGSSWSDLLTLPIGGALKTYSIALPADTRGEVLIRARDTDRTPRNSALDRLWVDQLEIVTMSSGTGSPPVAPTLEIAEAQGNGVLLAWSDNSDNELGFEVWRETFSGSAWGAPIMVGQTPADAVGWTDTSVAADTRYRYRVAAFTATDDAFSGSMEVTTPPAEPPQLSLSANGYKVKGRIVVDLEWQGLSPVDVYRSVDGSDALLVEDAPGSSHEDRTDLKGAPVLVYRVCAPNTSDCSNSVTLTF
jgi:hypothetical protein